MYSILITFSISQVIQAGLCIYLWIRLHQKHPLMIEATHIQPVATAPDFDSSKDW
jgi:hypothetical protein